MPVYVRMTSEDWRDYPALDNDDPEAWRAANPAAVQYGPFRSVEVRQRGQTIIGHETEGEPLLIAEVNYDCGWILWGHVHHTQQDPRMYDGFEIVSEE